MLVFATRKPERRDVGFGQVVSDQFVEELGYSCPTSQLVMKAARLQIESCELATSTTHSHRFRNEQSVPHKLG
jgi:hypothetical protein